MASTIATHSIYWAEEGRDSVGARRAGREQAMTDLKAQLAQVEAQLATHAARERLDGDTVVEYVRGLRLQGMSPEEWAVSSFMMGRVMVAICPHCGKSLILECKCGEVLSGCVAREERLRILVIEWDRCSGICTAHCKKCADELRAELDETLPAGEGTT